MASSFKFYTKIEQISWNYLSMIEEQAQKQLSVVTIVTNE